MSCAYAVAAGVAATNDQHILAFGSDALVFAKLDAGENPILLRQQFEGKMHALERAAGDGEVAGGGGTGGDDHG